MRIKSFLCFLDLFKKQFLGFNIFEKIFFPTVIFMVVFLSFLLNDNKIALVSAICGISYTILAGKGKILCYFIGIIGTFCYCYISFKNGFYGNLALYFLYFLPMQVLGIFNWFKNLNKDTGEIIKTKLPRKERIFYFILMLVLSVIVTFVLYILGGKTPIIDSVTTVFSIFAQYFTVKRCIEQWYLWFFVNVLTFIMWIIAYQKGSNCFATIIMWGVYIFLAVYFLYKWKKELISTVDNI